MSGKPFISLFLACCFIPGTVFCQKSALKQPPCLHDAASMVRIDQVIHDQCRASKNSMVPWVVYSNRGDDLGQPYYVVDENLTQFHIVSGTGVNGLTILHPRDKGFRPKSEFLFHFSADFTGEAMIHRKCIALNSQGLIDSICKGLVSESRIPVYADPYARGMMNSADPQGNILPVFLPFYSIYFIYQRENNRYLLGMDYKFEPGRSFREQVIGWVDSYRVFDFNTRLCFEPNWLAAAVRNRRCDTLFGNARVFASPREAEVFLASPKLNIEPVWEEPGESYLLHPALFEDHGSFSLVQLRKTTCKNSNGAGTVFTNAPLNADFFRFPFLGISPGSKKIIQVAVPGLYNRNRNFSCDSLSREKYNLKVFFILPDSLPNALSLFFLSQMNSRYPAFRKAYKACFYPQQANVYKTFGTMEADGDNYAGIVDNLLSHQFTGHHGHADVLSMLNQVLDREPFSDRETNLIVLVNTSRGNPAPHNLLNGIARKMAEKNCYLATFDFSGSLAFAAAIDTIMDRAVGFCRERHELPEIPVDWHREGNRKFLTSYLLAMQSVIDTGELKGPQILRDIRSAYDPLISTVSRMIQAVCSGNPDTLVLTPGESRFRQGLLKIVSGCTMSISGQRVLKHGYLAMKYENNGPDIWQGEVIMTEGELQDLTIQLDGLSYSQTGVSVCQKICSLWETVVSRFIGQQLMVNNAYLDLTICQVIGRMIGSSFDYYCNDPIKRFTLRDICECRQEVLETADAYIRDIGLKNAKLKTILHKNAFRFNRGSDPLNHCNYYWVPVSLLP